MLIAAAQQTCAVTLVVGNASHISTESMFAHVSGSVAGKEVDRELRIHFDQQRVSYPAEIAILENTGAGCQVYDTSLGKLMVRLYEKPLGDWYNTELSKDGHYQVKLLVVDKSSIRPAFGLLVIKSVAFTGTIISLLFLVRNILKTRIQIRLRTITFFFVHLALLKMSEPFSTKDLPIDQLRESRHHFDWHFIATRFLFLYLGILCTLRSFEVYLFYWYKNKKYIRSYGRCWIAIVIILAGLGFLLDYFHTYNSLKNCQPYKIEQWHNPALRTISRLIYGIVGFTAIAVSISTMNVVSLCTMLCYTLHMQLSSTCTGRPVDVRLILDYCLPVAAVMIGHSTQTYRIDDKSD